MSEEKRKHARYPFIEKIVMVTAQKESHVIVSENLSLGGIFLVSENPYPPGTEGLLVITFRKGGVRKDVSTTFRVVHNHPSQQGSRGMGVTFIDMTDESKNLLKKIVDTLK